MGPDSGEFLLSDSNWAGIRGRIGFVHGGFSLLVAKDYQVNLRIPTSRMSERRLSRLIIRGKSRTFFYKIGTSKILDLYQWLMPSNQSEFSWLNFRSSNLGLPTSGSWNLILFSKEGKHLSRRLFSFYFSRSINIRERLNWYVAGDLQAIPIGSILIPLPQFYPTGIEWVRTFYSNPCRF